MIVDLRNLLLIGDVLDRLRLLPDDSVDCIVTSPPYWGLRDYGASGQLGLEETFDEYLAKMVLIFKELLRVLKPSGTCWVNMGDCYATNSRGNREKVSDKLWGKHKYRNQVREPRVRAIGELKAKDLVGQPWALAFALRAAGWYLRQDIIWSKPAPMPESVRDRCTKAHEYLFLLTKRPRYYYDAEAIRQAVTGNAHSRGNGLNPKALTNSKGCRQNASFSGAICRPQGWAENGTEKTAIAHSRRIARQTAEPKHRKSTVNHPMGDRTRHDQTAYGANARSVWTIASRGYKGAHFATFPIELPMRCISAGCPPGGLVLDPFAGSGTTGEAAAKLGRDYLLVELNPKFVPLIVGRLGIFAPKIFEGIA